MRQSSINSQTKSLLKVNNKVNSSSKHSDKKNSTQQQVISTIQNPNTIVYENNNLNQNLLGKKTLTKVKRSYSLNKQDNTKEGFTHTVPNNSTQLTGRNNKGNQIIIKKYHF